MSEDHSSYNEEFRVISTLREQKNRAKNQSQHCLRVTFMTSSAYWTLIGFSGLTSQTNLPEKLYP